MSGDELVIPGSRRKAVLLLLIALGLVGGGVFLIVIGQPFGWIVAGFFALGIPLALLLLRPTYMKLDREGVRIVVPFRSWRLAWSDVEEFYLVTMYGNRMIAIRYAAPYAGQRTARKVAEAMSGMEGALPDHFTRSPEELCETLNQWRRRYGAGTAGSSR
jgi:hypothetical protein